MTTTKVALVTGASSGLGRVIATRLGRAGWTVGLVARRRERLDALADELRAAGGTVWLLPGDLRDAVFADGVVDALVDRAGRLDLLVNNAGSPTPPDRLAPAAEVPTGSEVASADQFDRVFALNVRAPYQLSQAARPHLERSGGSIVNVGSAGVARNLAMDLGYLASKGAIEVLGRGMAKLWAPLGIRVNTVSPGLVRTEILEAAGYPAEQVNTAFANAVAAFQPMPRPGEPDDVASAVLFLASVEAAFVTGVTLHVDGGMALGG